LRTRVRFSPPPPTKEGYPIGVAFFVVGAVQVELA